MDDVGTKRPSGQVIRERLDWRGVTLPTIQIIRATPGPTTSERIVTLLLANPQGLSVKQLSQELNRPFSMVQHCLKPLVASHSVAVRFSKDGRYWTYYLADRN